MNFSGRTSNRSQCSSRRFEQGPGTRLTDPDVPAGDFFINHGWCFFSVKGLRGAATGQRAGMVLLAEDVLLVNSGLLHFPVPSDHFYLLADNERW